MSAFTAQAILECHYSHNNAFLDEALIQVYIMHTHEECHFEAAAEEHEMLLAQRCICQSYDVERYRQNHD